MSYEVRDAWVGLLADRSDFVDGEIEHAEDAVGTFRGPITRIVIEENHLVVDTAWLARIPTDSHNRPIGEWQLVTGEGVNHRRYDLGGVDLPIMSAPQDIGDGRILFTYPFSIITLFPEGGSKLDPGDVRGM